MLKLSYFNLNIFRFFIIFSLAILVAVQDGNLPLTNATATTISTTLQNVEELNKQQKYETSINILLNALVKHPNSESLIITFKQTFTLHLYSQISNSRKRIALNKQDLDAYLSIARSYSLIGEKIKAMEILLEGVVNNPNSTDLWMTIGTLELQAHRDTEALSVFKEIIRIDLKNGNAYNNIAYIMAGSNHKDIHNLKAALSYAQKANSLEPNNPNFIDTLAQIKFQLGQKQEAVSLINQAINLDPDEDYFKKQLLKFQSENGEAELYSKPVF